MASVAGFRQPGCWPERRKGLGQHASQIRGTARTAGADRAGGFAGAGSSAQLQDPRSSSWDGRRQRRRGGGGAGPGATLLDITGAGVVTHLWFTINSQDRMHLKNLVLRAWWDGEATPSVEVHRRLFRLGLGEYFVYQSELTVVASAKALNAYFKMPFSSSARLSVANEGKVRTTASTSPLTT